MSRREWPELGPVEIAAATVLTGGAVVAGIAEGESVQAFLLDRLCTEAGCQPVGLAVAGWAAVGAPLLLAGLVFLLSRPGRPALYAMLGCVALLSFGFTAIFNGPAEGTRDTHPEVSALGVGFVAATIALILGASIAKPLHTPSRQPPRFSTAVRTPETGLPLLVVCLCQGVALAGVLIWVTVAR